MLATPDFSKSVTAAMPMLRRFAISLCRNSERADDLVQETVARALEKRNSFEIGSNLEAWLTTILKNLFFSQHRNLGREVEDIDGAYSDALSVDDGSSAHDQDEAREIMRLVDALPGPQADAIKLIAEGLTYEQIATRLGIDEGTVKSRVHRARQILRQLRPAQERPSSQPQDEPPSGLRSIEASLLKPVEAKTHAGELPRMAWIAIASLRIDERYQRRVLDRGRTNIYTIAREFDWRKFTPVIVAEIGDEYAVIDGQHRSYAAALRGIKDVPCMIVKATLGEQAAAFAAINGQVTHINELQVHAAKVTAGDPTAVAIDAICTASGVMVCRYPVPEKKMKPAQTLAIGSLQMSLRLHGPDVLTLALRCLVVAHPDDRGVIRAHTIRAMCEVLAKGIDVKHALAGARQINFVRELVDAQVRSATSGRSIRVELAEALLRRFGGKRPQ